MSPLGRVFVLASLVFVFVAGATLGFFDRESAAAEVCSSFGVPLLVVWWAECDADRTRYWPAFHYSWFLLVLWPIAVPHYVIHTRGWRGVGLALALVGAICAPLLGWGLGNLLFPIVWPGAELGG
jgi:hypothetical protein